jgi:hypothetical protein
MRWMTGEDSEMEGETKKEKQDTMNSNETR